MSGAFLHLRNTRNVGDRWCSPFDWFDWPEDCFAHDLSAPARHYDWAVIGGGKVLGGLASYGAVLPERRAQHIAWGVSTVQSFPISLRYWRARRLVRIVGSRDYGDRDYDWAPCASCMSPDFDNLPAPEQDVVFYSHGGKTARQGIEIPREMLSASNVDFDDLGQALRFIARGKTVVTNSYHGTYWALLMGRKVLCVPFSGKFARYRLPPAFSTPKDWLSELGKAVAQPDMMDLCRARSREFHGMVLKEVERMSLERKALGFERSLPE